MLQTPSNFLWSLPLWGGEFKAYGKAQASSPPSFFKEVWNVGNLGLNS
jgi:hypothetical protein